MLQPDDARQAHSPRWNPDDHLLTILNDNATHHGSDIAMRERDHGIWREFTWSQYQEHVLAFAAKLEEDGLRQGDIVLVLGDNRPALYFGMLAAIALRAIPSPAYPDTTPDELAGQIEREKIRFAIAEDQEQVDKLTHVATINPVLRMTKIIYDDVRGLQYASDTNLVSYDDVLKAGRERLERNASLAQSLSTRSQAEDIAALLHSSGTTGAPKGIPLKHGHILHGVRSAAQAGYFREGEIHMAYLPIAWVGDFIFSIGAALALRFIVNVPERQETSQHDLREIAPTLYFCSPRAWSNMLTRIQVGMDESTPFKRRLYNHFMSFAIGVERKRLEGKSPGFLQKLWLRAGNVLIYGPIKDHLGLSRVTRPYTAGEAIGEEVFLFFRALGLNLRQFYGQTENCALAAAQSPDEVQLHTVGRPFPGVEIKIDDSGEILMRGDNVFDGYYDQPEDTAKTLKNGWLHTGDAGFFEEDGQLVVLGRVSEVVHTAQKERFIPTYIENRLQFSQYIRDACVLGEERDYLSSIICIDFQAVGHWAGENNVSYSSYAELSQHPAVYDLIESLIQRSNQLLPDALRIHRFINLHKEFDANDGEVTRTRKLRRSVINKNYKVIIDALYSGANEIEFEAPIVYETGDTGVLKRELTIRDIAPLGSQ
ncbi:AMP-binding protein [Paenalcaligenes niemegkensis]|uniref:AMP-dependent synthetase/ligase n=1 Tax=Paenalcaligenes niemegkensis TaxID=2895469 RepID=UPI001EE88AA7|nr:AMP-binding protein [Paenalcaligenes niemegkensis]MCQ9615476.1 AMP-binding protein [Paenalcaligenes niemegkensis]